jgi:hypothetical protein
VSSPHLDPATARDLSSGHGVAAVLHRRQNDDVRRELRKVDESVAKVIQSGEPISPRARSAPQAVPSSSSRSAPASRWRENATVQSVSPVFHVYQGAAHRSPSAALLPLRAHAVHDAQRWPTLLRGKCGGTARIWRSLPPGVPVHDTSSMVMHSPATNSRRAEFLGGRYDESGASRSSAMNGMTIAREFVRVAASKGQA